MGNSNSSQTNTVLPYNDFKAYTPHINFSLDSVQTSQPNVSTVPVPMTGGNNSRVSIVPQRRRYVIDSDQPKTGGKYVSAKQDTNLNSEEYKYIKNMVYSDLVNNNQDGGDGSLYSETTQDGGTVYSATSHTQNGGGSVYSDTTLEGGTVYSATSHTQNGGGSVYSDTSRSGGTIYSATSYTHNGGGCGCSASENNVEYSATSNTQNGGEIYSATSVTQQESKHRNPDGYSVGGSTLMSETSLFNTDKDIQEVQQYLETLKAQNGGNDNVVYSATSNNLDFDGIMTGGQEPSSTSSSTSSSSSSDSSSDDSSSSSSTNETETSKKKTSEQPPKKQARTKNLMSSTQSSSPNTSSANTSSANTSSANTSSNLTSTSTKMSSTQASSLLSSNTQTSSAQTSRVQTSSAQTSSAQTSSAQTSSAQTSSAQMSSAQHNKSTNGGKYSSSDIFSSLSGGSEYLNTMRNRDRMH
jgi:hypothetical protein